MNSKTVNEIFARFELIMPNPTTELRYGTPFELLVAVILSARATDVSVNIATTKLFPVANTPQAILTLGTTKLKSYIKNIGLYKTKGDRIIETCKILLKKYEGKVPRRREDLESLPGVGRKTANVILNTLFGEKTIAVDTHIFRVSNRTGLAHGKTPLTVEKKLQKIIPEVFKKNAHHWLVLHGRYTCIARKPKCYACVIMDLCEYKDKERARNNSGK